MKQYINYKLSKLLSKTDFCQKCNYSYAIKSKSLNYACVPEYFTEMYYLSPTLDQLHDWFESKGIRIDVFYDKYMQIYRFSIHYKGIENYINGGVKYKTRKRALKAAIKWLLNNQKEWNE